MPFRCLVTLTAACVLGCAASGTAPGVAAPVDAAALLAAIQSEIGDAACDTDTQCHSIGVGAKACGGPEAYLAWSDKLARPALLADLAARHRAARELENASRRLQSNCALVTDPGAVCRPRASDDRSVCRPGPSGSRDVR
jgi:hypothetical protein